LDIRSFLHIARRYLALEDLRDEDAGIGRDDYSFRDKINAASQQFEVPVIMLKLDIKDEDITNTSQQRRSNENKRLWATNISEARIFMKDTLATDDTAIAFPFFRLPAELRMKIYE